MVMEVIPFPLFTRILLLRLFSTVFAYVSLKKKKNLELSSRDAMHLLLLFVLLLVVSRVAWLHYG
jgi:hypothetical protein